MNLAPGYLATEKFSMLQHTLQHLTGAALNTAVLLSGSAEERHHGFSSLRHGPSGLRERVKLGLHGSAQHRARRHHQLRHGGQLPADVAHRGQVHGHPEEITTSGSAQPRRGSVLQSPVAQQL